jgi:hypothetical protein
MAGNELVERVDERRRSDRPQDVSERMRQPHLGEERDAPSRVAGNRRPVAKDEPPAVATFVFRHGGQEFPGFFVSESEQAQPFVPIDLRDDTRRPPAELSGSGIEQYRTREPSGRHVRRKHVFGHRVRLSVDNQIFKY